MRSSWTRARTRVPCVGRRILKHCATREVPMLFFYNHTHLPTSHSCFLCPIITSGPLAVTNLFSISIILSFPRCYVNGIIQHVTFSTQHNSLEIVACMFFFLAKKYSMVWIYPSSPNHSPVEGYLSYFQLSFITHKAAMYIYVQAFV